MRILAERLREQRKMSSMTQDEIAQMLGIKRATYGEYERGNNLPPIDKLTIIANAFGVSIDYLVGNTDESLNIKKILKSIETIKLLACTIENTLKD